MKLSISQRIGMVIGFGLVVLLFVSAVCYRSMEAFFAAVEQRKMSYQVMLILDGMTDDVKDLQGAELAYATTGKKDYAAGYRKALQGLEQDLVSLKAMLIRDRRELDRVRSLEPLVAAASKSALKNRRAPAKLLNSMSDLVAGIEEDERALLAARETAAQRSSQKALSVILVVGLTSLVIVIVGTVITLWEVRQKILMRKSLGESEEQFRLLVEGVKDYAIISLDPEGRITSWNAGAERITGYTEKEIAGKHFSTFYAEEEIKSGKPGKILQTAAASGRTLEEALHVRKDGTKYWGSVIITALHDEQGRLRGFSKVIRDVSDRRRSEESMKKLSLSVEQATDLVVMTDREGTVEYVNKAAEEVMGYSREELIGKSRDVWRNEQDPKTLEEMNEALQKGRPFQTIVTNRKKSGEVIYVYEVTTPLKDVNGRITHFVTTGRDITQQKTMEERLNYLAFFDALTGIPNRTLFLDRLTQGIARARYAKKIIGMVVIDVDRFKFVNDLYGLEAGDRILKTITKRLVESVREGDTVARLGGDDFGILLFDVAEADDIILVVKKIMESVTIPIKERGEEAILTASIGISVYPYDGETARDLMKNADIALRKAKQQGRNNYQFYTKDMNIKAMEFVSIDKQLFNSFKNREFMLYYQPYWNTMTQKISGMEALIRWNSKNQGVVSPARFIPILEDTGMIIEVGNWITKSVCRQIREWQDAGHPALPVSVNISSVQFRRNDIAETILAAVEETSIDPRLLTLEITESTFMQNTEFATQVLKKLKEHGLSISLDDFGTGYSSLSYLQKFPFDNLKIDISFIRGLTLDSDAAAIVSAIVAMARSLNLKTIAEGVESEELWKILRLLQCDMVQGNYFSPPLPPQGVEIYFE